MRMLKPNEVEFIKETHWTPTVHVCDEWHKTPYIDAEEARLAAIEYDIDLEALYNDCTRDVDFISLANEAAYLLFVFFSLSELEEMSAVACLDWLQNFKYFFGFRKWSETAADCAREEAIGIYTGEKVIKIADDKSVWVKDNEAA